MFLNLFLVFLDYLYLRDDRKYNNYFFGNCIGNNICGGNMLYWVVIFSDLCKVKCVN